jgi:hypothetical protein
MEHGKDVLRRLDIQDTATVRKILGDCSEHIYIGRVGERFGPEAWVKITNSIALFPRFVPSLMHQGKPGFIPKGPTNCDMISVPHDNAGGQISTLQLQKALP